ncbi:hypothetical protein IG631_00039 [Alternaria alternata]|nr:hypothetical protein IG631_00039 [Alternaria alternata]
MEGSTRLSMGKPLAVELGPDRRDKKHDCAHALIGQQQTGGMCCTLWMRWQNTRVSVQYA